MTKMTKNLSIKIIAALVAVNFIWIFGAAYVNDFHPNLGGFHAAFVIKGFINSFILIYFTTWTMNRWEKMEWK